MNKTNNFNDLLKRTGLKITKHRNSILEVISNSNQPITAEDIYISLKDDNISINFSSVYRILDTLVSNSIVTKVIFEENNKTLYEIKKNVHNHHLICNNCKKVVSLPSCPLAIYEKEISQNLDFEITNHKFEIYGYCKSCKKNAI